MSGVNNSNSFQSGTLAISPRIYFIHFSTTYEKEFDPSFALIHPNKEFSQSEFEAVVKQSCVDMGIEVDFKGLADRLIGSHGFVRVPMTSVNTAGLSALDF